MGSGCFTKETVESSTFHPFFDATLPGWPKVIGGVTAENPVWLAPLAGVTFGSFRRFHRALGAGLVHTEMVSALGLKYRGRKTKELLYGSESERPCVIQLFSSNAEDIACGAEVALDIKPFDVLEVNMACPMPKVTKKGSGSKLMEYPDEAVKIVRFLKRFGLPVWVKTRIMPPNESMTTEDFCGLLFDAGADFIFLHGRTPAQRYEGTASREAVCKAAKLFPGMIGGSGDCFAPGDLTYYLDNGCAAVLAARGVLRDAFLIPRTLKKLGCDVPAMYCNPSPTAQVDILLGLGSSIYNTEGGAPAMTIVRRMLGAIFKGFNGASQMRRAGAMMKNWPELAEMLVKWRDTLNANTDVECENVGLHVSD